MYSPILILDSLSNCETKSFAAAEHNLFRLKKARAGSNYRDLDWSMNKKSLMEICKTCLCHKYKMNFNTSNSETQNIYWLNVFMKQGHVFLYNNKRPLNLNSVLVYDGIHN